jgi:hypothetical protein
VPLDLRTPAADTDIRTHDRHVSRWPVPASPSMWQELEQQWLAIGNKDSVRQITQ